jgi:hypothetical protein
MLFPVARAAARPHAGSISQSKIIVSESGTTLQIRCQVLSLVEVIPGLIGATTEPELQQAIADERIAIGTYLAAHFRLTAHEVSQRFAIQALVDQAQTRLIPAEMGVLGGFDLVDILLPFDTEGREFHALGMEVDLFLETSPDHRDLCQIEWRDESAEGFLFSAYDPIWRWPPAPLDRGSQLANFFRLGLSNFWFGVWSLVMTIGLVAGPATSKGLALRLFALMLTVSALYAGLSPSSVPVDLHLIKLAVVLSVAYIGADRLLHADAGDRPVEAILFGVVHGLVLGSGLALELRGEYWRLWPSLGFGIALCASALLLGGLIRLLLSRLDSGELDRRRTAASKLLAASLLIVGGAGFIRLL